MAPTDPEAPSDSNPSASAERAYGVDTPPSVAVVRAIAAIENVDPIESPAALGVTLHDHVDTEALDRLVSSNDGLGRVTIDLELDDGRQYAVSLRDSGRLVVNRST